MLKLRVSWNKQLMGLTRTIHLSRAESQNKQHSGPRNPWKKPKSAPIIRPKGRLGVGLKSISFLFPFSGNRMSQSIRLVHLTQVVAGERPAMVAVTRSRDSEFHSIGNHSELKLWLRGSALKPNPQGGNQACVLSSSQHVIAFEWLHPNL